MPVTKRIYKNLGITIEAEKVVYMHKSLMGDITYSSKQKSPDEKEYALNTWGGDLIRALDAAENRIISYQRKEEVLAQKIEEYNRLYASMKEDVRAEVGKELELCKKEILKQANEKIKNQTEEANKRCNEAEIKAAETESRNRNLYRIMRERSNKARGLSPIKKRSGYVLLKTENAQYRYQYEEPRIYYQRGTRMESNELIRKTGYRECYKSVYETPYLPTIDVKSLEDVVVDDWFALKWGDKRERKQACTWYQTNGYYSAPDDLQRIFAWEFNPNFEKNIWTITIYHTQPLQPIEENLKIFKPKKGK